MSFFIKVLLTITVIYGIFAPFLPLFRANKKPPANASGLV
nr:MAG TPA: hypothetical protein [Caudoviricetes sp.]